jgi:hypothetical protein
MSEWVSMTINSSDESLRWRELLRKLTKAVCLQIELWDTVADLEALVDTDFDPLAWVQTTSTDVESGNDLTMADVDDYLAGIKDSGWRDNRFALARRMHCWRREWHSNVHRN